MRVTTADLWSPAPGRMLRWDVTAEGTGTPVALSFNQRNHLAAARAGEAVVWLAASFDVDGPIDVTALERAFQALVERHSSLQVGVSWDDAEPSGVRAGRHRPEDIRWLVREVACTRSSDGTDGTAAEEATRSAVAEALTDGCLPPGYAAFVPLAISRRDRSTVVLGMDHLHCDALSTAIVVDELAVLYDAFRRGQAPPTLAAPGCFVSAVAAELEDPVRIPVDDDRMQEWHAFARDRDYRLPTFPLALGVPPGERRPQAATLRDLADTATTELLGLAGRAAAASTYAVVLAALAAAVEDLGGPDRLATLAPVQTRADHAEQRSIGWYTTSVPLTIAADTDAAGLAAAGEAVRRGVRLGAVPLDQVMAALPVPLRPVRRDVFMVSWVDYRHLPGAGRALERNAHHISASTLADDVQLWVSRTDAGLAVRVRHPDTETAHDVIAALLDAWRARLLTIVH